MLSILGKVSFFRFFYLNYFMQNSLVKWKKIFYCSDFYSLLLFGASYFCIIFLLFFFLLKVLFFFLKMSKFWWENYFWRNWMVNFCRWKKRRKMLFLKCIICIFLEGLCKTRSMLRNFYQLSLRCTIFDYFMPTWFLS